MPDKVRSDFLFRIMFSRLLTASDTEAVLGERRALLGAAIDRLEACAEEIDEPGRRFVHGFGLTVYRAMADYIDEHGHELVGASLLGERAVAE